MPYFLRHFSTQVDRLIMLDGGCQDQSIEMIQACKNAEVRASPFQFRYDDALYVNYLKELYPEARGQADWVVIVDTDEFLYSTVGLRAALAGYRERSVRGVKALGYQMVSNRVPIKDAPLTKLVRSGFRDPEYDKLVAFDPELDVSWRPGRHNYTCNIECHQPDLKLLHYRFFGEQYLRERNVQNCARRSVADVATGRGYHCLPEHTGKYSLGWWLQAAKQARNVIQ